VQKTINRILFLIICEYRSIEKYEKLKEIVEKDHIYKNLIYYFEKSDEKYNSGIFDFKNDNCTKDLIIDDRILRDIIVDLYYPKSPYDFSILSIEIIGKVYEQFLGKTIRLTSSHQAKVEEKPEIRKAGGIYYTPEYVVEYILENTIGKLIKDKTPKQIEEIKILDSACGSGTFLVRAYNYLLNYHLGWYIANHPEKYKKEVYSYKDGYLLSTDIKKKILLNNIFGVDIDPQAVEITKLSLLLKVLENENKEKVEQQLRLFNERILPNIDNNIKCGNSVVDSSYFIQTTITNKSQEDIIKINPFDWKDKNTGFGNIIADGGFDIIIGNPPYVKEYTNQEIFEPVKKSYLSKYYQGKMDFWYLFTCQAIDLLKEGGLHSYIAPSNWTTNAGASILRNKILKEGKILSFFDFNDYKVFKDASIQTMVFVIQKEKYPKSYFVDYYKIIDKNISKEELKNYLATKKAGKKVEYIKSKISTNELLNKTINFTSTDVNKILDYIKERSNFILTDKDVGQGIVAPQDIVNDKHLVVLKDNSIKKGDGIFNLSLLEFNKFNFSPKEKAIIKPFYTTIELKKYYGNPINQLWVIYSDIKIRQNINEYPNIKKHLEKFKQIITSDFAPYGLHRAREQKFFEGRKIISLRKTAEPCFTFTDFPCYVSQTYFIIKPENIDLKYLTGLLNSKLIYFWLKHKGKKQGEQLQIDKAPLLEIPIHKPILEDKEEQKLEKEIIQFVDTIIELYKKLDQIKLDSEKQLINKQIKAKESKINELIYKLYKLTEKDITAIETIKE
jgi:adenine-specific DNA-methyltransferase